MSRTMADVLAGLIESGLLPDRSGKEPQAVDAASDPPVSLGTPWIDPNRIRASSARDVVERNNDDRSRAWRREMGARFAAVVRLSRPAKFRFGAQVKAKAARLKPERTPEVREYFRLYMHERRAREKTDASQVGV